MIPSFIRPFLWSYDVNLMDLKRDKRRIITNVLNLGTRKATDWLFNTYTEEEVKDCLSQPLPGEWNKKSIAFWSFLLGVNPGPVARIIR